MPLRDENGQRYLDRHVPYEAHRLARQSRTAHRVPREGTGLAVPYPIHRPRRVVGHNLRKADEFDSSDRSKQTLAFALGTGTSSVVLVVSSTVTTRSHCGPTSISHNCSDDFARSIWRACNVPLAENLPVTTTALLSFPLNFAFQR
jgi:hypothetical protein